MSIFDILEENGIESNFAKKSDLDILEEYSDIKDFTDKEKLLTEKGHQIA